MMDLTVLVRCKSRLSALVGERWCEFPVAVEHNVPLPRRSGVE